MRTGGAANYRQRGTGRVATVTAVALPDGRRVALASACEHQRHAGMRAAPLSLLSRPRASLRAYLAIAAGIERASEVDDGSPRPVGAVIWTDGACRRNPGPGGWAALVCWDDGVVEEHSGGLALTTNNIMEMTAALEGLRALPDGSRVCIVTDSRYLHDGMTSWMAGWMRKDWQTGAGVPVKNKEIWVQLDIAASDHEQVRWHWIKAHIGHALNERADVLAVTATRNAARSAR